MKTPQDRRLEKLEAALKLAVKLLNTPSLVTVEAAEQIIRLANSCFPDETIFPEWNVEAERLWYSDEVERITRECEAYNKLNYTSIEPFECIRIDGNDLKVMPVFDMAPNRYTFMAGIVGGFPVFSGEEVCMDGRSVFVRGRGSVPNSISLSCQADVPVHMLKLSKR